MKYSHRYNLNLLSACALFITAGCMVGPDFTRPPPPAADAYLSENERPAQHFRYGQALPPRWWTLFGCDRLNALVEAAIANHPSLEAQNAALREARQDLEAGAASLFPTIAGNAMQTRESNIPGRTNTASLTVSYLFDVFGGTRRQIEALGAEVDIQKYQLEAATLTLAANVVTTVVQIASLRGQIEATGDIINAETETLKTLERQFALGGQTRAVVAAQQTQLALTRSALPPLQQHLAAVRHNLAVLTGAFPRDFAAADFELAELHLPKDLPVALPSALVEQRPDIKMAEAQIHQASARIGVATANMLPQLTLSGGYGRANMWTLSEGIIQPIFDGGALQAQRDAAMAAYDQTAAQYRLVMLNAFQNVADALTALLHDEDALIANEEAVNAARVSLDLTQKQYAAGAVEYVTLLVQQQQFQQARIGYVQAAAGRFADAATLLQALGGGWGNRETQTTSTLEDGNAHE